jgi:hypothetical protein
MKLNFIEIDESGMDGEDLLAERELQPSQAQEFALILNYAPAPNNLQP